VNEKLPIFFLLHPMGIGSTRDMNVKSAKIWLRALVDILPDVVISAPWLPYAEAVYDRERGLRDALACAQHHDGAVAVGGEFSRGTTAEWDFFGKLGRPRIDLTKRPMPAILTPESFVEALTPQFRQMVTQAFQGAIARKAA
jgi:hypothetical protein